MHFNTISGRHGGVPYSGVEIRRRTHTLLDFLFIHFELKKADLVFTVEYTYCKGGSSRLSRLVAYLSIFRGGNLMLMYCDLWPKEFKIE